MRVSKITFASLLMFCFFFSLNLEGQNASGSGFEHLDRMDCNSCHSSWTNSILIPETQTSEPIPHQNNVDFYIDYVSKITNENAALKGVDLEGVKRYIKNHK